MKVLLDTKDLINVLEHNRPMKLSALRDYLRTHDSTIVLTFNNVRELVAPLSQGGDSIHIRCLLQKLETLSLSYLAEAGIPTEEVKEGVRAFNSASEYKPINPWVSRWDETMPGQRPMLGRMLIRRLDEIVLDIAGEESSVFAGYGSHEDALRQQFETDRRIPASARVPEQNFPRVIGRFISHFGIEKPTRSMDDFAKWVYEDPRRCPGLRLGYEVFHELLKNVGDKPDASDIPDISHTNAIPYVDGATVDRRMHGYCSQVCRRLQKTCSLIDYSDRIFPNLEALMSAKQ